MVRDTFKNPSKTICSGSSHALQAASFALIHDFTCDMIPSQGIKSRLYGGRKTSNAPVVCMACTTSATWCIAALSDKEQKKMFNLISKSQSQLKFGVFNRKKLYSNKRTHYNYRLRIDSVERPQVGGKVVLNKR